MEKIQLVDVDSKIPNLALMKISTAHKKLGNKVDLKEISKPDKVYISCVFKENRSQALGIAKMFNCPVEIGGYGVNNKSLPDHIDHVMPDYSLYNVDYSMGYTSRGCIRKCPFCIVWKKEGWIRDNAPVKEFWNPKHKKLVLLDNNLLASPKCEENLKFLAQNKIKTTFCQGLDIRLVNNDNASLLSKVNARTMSFKSKMYHFAFDDPQIEDDVRKGVSILKKHGISLNFIKL